ncbi:hypothetical protein YC2023_049986 [Brassica napus]
MRSESSKKSSTDGRDAAEGIGNAKLTCSLVPFFELTRNLYDKLSLNFHLKPNRRCKEQIKTTRDVADFKRRLLQFDVQKFGDNFEKGMMKALKDISKNQKKSTSTRAPVAESSLFISKKSKGKSETHVMS